VNGAILAIDTASPAGFALAFRAAPGRPLETAAAWASQEHSRQLLPAIDALVGEARRALAAIGVVTGPGSYAGLRVGIATAESLAFGLGIAAYGVSTFEAAAATEAAAGAELLVHPAGRGEWAVQALRDGALQGQPFLAEAEELPGVRIAGEGATPLGGREVSPRDRAAAVVRIVEERMRAGQVPSGLAAVYLREPAVTRPRRTPLVAADARATRPKEES
jgi:tRNA threonylcarbamoyl adenosine modification protein YeaZ